MASSAFAPCKILFEELEDIEKHGITVEVDDLDRYGIVCEPSEYASRGIRQLENGTFSVLLGLRF